MSTVTSFKGTKGPSWVHESPFLTIGWEETSDSGAPSLKHSAMRQALSDQSMLTPDLFTNVPWEIAKYLWGCLGSSKKRTVYMWKLLAIAYPSRFREISRYRCMRIEGPRMPMREYLGLVKNDSLHWGVVLTLFTSFASVPELVEIASVKNLVALELNTSSELETSLSHEAGTPVTALNDRIVRTWSELASDAFAHLRVLRISHQEQVSRVSLRYLKCFPSLRLLVVCDCSNITRLFGGGGQAVEGWKPIKRVKPVESITEPDKLYMHYETSFAMGDGETEPSMREDTPILGFQIGREVRRSLQRPIDLVYLERQGHQEHEAPEPAAKRPKKASQTRERLPGRQRKATMKERPAKDLNSVLRDLL